MQIQELAKVNWQEQGKILLFDFSATEAGKHLEELQKKKLEESALNWDLPEDLSIQFGDGISREHSRLL